MYTLRSASGAPLVIFTGEPSEQWIAKYCVDGNWLDKNEGDRAVPASVVAQALKALGVAHDLANDRVRRLEANFTEGFSPDLMDRARNHAASIDQASEALKKFY